MSLPNLKSLSSNVFRPRFTIRKLAFSSTVFLLILTFLSSFSLHDTTDSIKLTPSELLTAPSTVSPVDGNVVNHDILTSNNPFVNPKLSTNTHADHPPHCVHVIPLDTPQDVWLPYNSRSFCITSHVCISPKTIHQPSQIYHDHLPSPSSSSLQNKATCQLAGPSLTTNIINNKAFSCNNLHESVFCAQGHFSPHQNTTIPICPISNPLSSASLSSSKISSSSSSSTKKGDKIHIPGLSIVIPSYPFIGNIYHFSQAIIPTIHVLSKLSSFINPLPNNITIIVRGRYPKKLGLWQHGLTTSLLNQRIKKSMGLENVQLYSLLEDEAFVYEAGSLELNLINQTSDTVCMDNSIMLGQRYNPTMWPFASHDHSGTWPFKDEKQLTKLVSNSVPFESVALRSAVYHENNISTILPNNIDNFSTHSSSSHRSSNPLKSILLDFPPLTMTYARRHSFKTGPANESLGNFRKFTEKDDSWFTAMVKREGKRRNFKVQLGEPSIGTSFHKQVEAFRHTGIVVGIHGANLMNSIFLPAFSALVEISPLTFQCYVAGSNAGLTYWHYKPTKESNDTSEQNLERNYRKILIDTRKDRQYVVQAIRESMAYITGLRRWFGHLKGIPVVYNETGDVYAIDWSQKRSQTEYSMQLARERMSNFFRWRKKRRTKSWLKKTE